MTSQIQRGNDTGPQIISVYSSCTLAVVALRDRVAMPAHLLLRANVPDDATAALPGTLAATNIAFAVAVTVVVVVLPAGGSSTPVACSTSCPVFVSDDAAAVSPPTINVGAAVDKTVSTALPRSARCCRVAQTVEDLARLHTVFLAMAKPAASIVVLNNL